MIKIQVEPLTIEAYQEYGDIISNRADRTPVLANMGTARKLNHLAKLENLRPGAQPNMSLFRCTPAPDGPFQIKLLEHHFHSTQMFIPMCSVRNSEQDGRFLVIVCKGGREPDISTLKVFVARKTQGITYRPGIWHHPMVALDEQTDFACLVWEDGSSEDCTVKELKEKIWTQWERKSYESRN